jgi:hypothetical protein
MKRDTRHSVDSSDDRGKFARVTAGMAITTVAAFGLGMLFGVNPVGALRVEGASVLIGLGAVAPLAIFLEWFMRARDVRLVAFRDSQVGFFAGVGFEFTSLRIAILSLGAGISEELMFRGVLQSWADIHLHAALAIALPNILFGALHSRTALYALIAGAVGIYLGAIFWWTNNLIAPIVAHAAYDAYALFRTRGAIRARNSALRP